MSPNVIQQETVTSLLLPVTNAVVTQEVWSVDLLKFLNL